MKRDKGETLFFSNFARLLTEARRQRHWTQTVLATRSRLNKSDIAKIEGGSRLPTLEQWGRLASALDLPLQWFLSGTPFPKMDRAEAIIQLHFLGVVDFLTPSDCILGAFRPAEEIVTWVLRGNAPDPRIVEAIPTVLAWNAWNARLLEAYAGTEDPRVSYRIAWLADVALTIHRVFGFPGGFLTPFPLEVLVKQATPPTDTDDLGRPELHETLPPVSRRWNISYSASLDTFHQRAKHLYEMRTADTPRRKGRRRKTP